LPPAGEALEPLWACTGDNLWQAIHDLTAAGNLCLAVVPDLNQAPEVIFLARALAAVVLVVEVHRHRADVMQRNLQMV
jgi:hypothetical protein